jgi:hypothetical protein
MNPLDKAKELVEKFWALDMKFLALVTVDEIISACEYNNVEGWNTDWWNKVKLEIEKI